MKLLNLCCGATRPQDPIWTNLDQLHPVLLPDTPERIQLDSEPRYTEHDVLAGPLPYPDDTFDGVLASHCVEHWDCQQAVTVMKECRRVLKPGGCLLVSVPDATYFRTMHDYDNVENAKRVFGEPIHLPDGETTFFGYGLWNRFHKAILTRDSLWCYFVRAGFAGTWEFEYTGQQPDGESPHTDSLFTMGKLLNRLQFSLLMTGYKP